jgi:hypothetical protein
MASDLSMPMHPPPVDGDTAAAEPSAQEAYMPPPEINNGLGGPCNLNAGGNNCEQPVGYDDDVYNCIFTGQSVCADQSASSTACEAAGCTWVDQADCDGACTAADCCPYAQRCLGDSVCQTGSTGTACAACDVSADPRYYMYAFNGDCVAGPTDAGILVVVMSMLLIAAFLSVLHHLTAIAPHADAGAVKVMGSVVSIAFARCSCRANARSDSTLAESAMSLTTR